jgi:hypothetical protein
MPYASTAACVSQIQRMKNELSVSLLKAVGFRSVMLNLVIEIFVILYIWDTILEKKRITQPISTKGYPNEKTALSHILVCMLFNFHPDRLPGGKATPKDWRIR